MGSVPPAALIEAPVDAVWDLVGDPNRYPGVGRRDGRGDGPRDRRDGRALRADAEATARPTHTTEFVVDELEEMREISVRCTQSRLVLCTGC